jgi:hypothetical protein
MVTKSTSEQAFESAIAPPLVDQRKANILLLELISTDNKVYKKRSRFCYL